MTDALVPNITYFLNNVDPFNKMPEPLVRQVASTVKITYVGKGETLDPCINSTLSQPAEVANKAIAIVDAKMSI